MTETAVAAPRLDLAAVVRTTFAAVGRNLVPITLASFMLGGLPDLVLEAAKFGLPSVDETGWNAIGRIVSIFTGVIVQGAVTSIILADLEGRSMTSTEGLGIGLRRFGAIFGVTLLSGLGVLLGLLLLIIPGLLLAARWAVVVPVVLIEGRSAREALSRSQALTKGLLWPIVGLLVLLMVAVLILAVGLGALAGVLSLVIGATAADLVGVLLVSTSIGVLISPGAAVLYVELRQLREGLNPHELAKVFD